MVINFDLFEPDKLAVNHFVQRQWELVEQQLVQLVGQKAVLLLALPVDYLKALIEMKNLS